MKYNRNSVVLTLCLPVDRAKMVLNRLWACGCLSDEQYRHKMLKVDARAFDNEKKKRENLERLYGEVKTFFEGEKK